MMQDMQDKTVDKTSSAEVDSTNQKEKDQKSESAIPKGLQEFIRAGVQFGHRKSVVHPAMFPYIFATRNNIHIIDVALTQEKLTEALVAIKKIIEEKKVILFVCTKVPMREIVKGVAEELNMPFVVNRWYGGTLTNWKTIAQRIQYLKDLRAKKKSEEWKKYPKHERMAMNKEIAKLEHNLGGIENMEKVPAAIFIADIHKDKLAVREAKKIGVVSFGIVDTNVNPEDVNYPIPANDDSIASVELILNKVKDAVLKVKPIKSKPKRPKLKK